MPIQRVETGDIFRSAFLLCHGGELARINVKDRAGRRASFVLRGEGLREVDREYGKGRGGVEPAPFLEALSRLQHNLSARLKAADGGGR